MKLSVFLLTFAVVSALHSSDCRSVDRLLQLSASSSEPAVVLYQAAQQGSNEALDLLTAWATDNQSEHWLALAANAGDVKAQYEQAMQVESLSRQRSMLLVPANKGHAPSQHELALLSDNNQMRQRWLQSAAEQGYQPAIVSLANWLQLIGESDNAIYWLEQAAQFEPESALRLATKLWRKGQYESAMRHISQAAEFGSAEAQRLHATINQHWQKPITWIEGADIECLMRIQPVVATLNGTAQALDFIQQYEQDERINGLPICFGEPVWRDIDLECDARYGGQRRLGCNPALLSDIVRASNATHIAVFAEQGKANVHNGIMYLDQSDTYDVFVHELAHFVGFADEYPISGEFAQQLCQRTDIPNLVFVPSKEERRNDAIQKILAETPIHSQQYIREKLSEADAFPGDVNVNPNTDKWSGLPFAIQLASARTCNNSGQQAFKPVSDITFLEHHDTGMIPPLYAYLWESRLRDPGLTIPVYVNLAQYFDETGETKKAQYWWQQYQQFLAVGEAE